MSAISRIVQQQNLVEVLQELSALLKNPKAINEAQELVRSEFKLTEDERKKADLARTHIKQYEQVAAELKQKSELIEKSAHEHSQGVKAFMLHQEIERKRIEQATAENDAKAVDLAQKEKFLTSRYEALNTAILDFEMQKDEYQKAKRADYDAINTARIELRDRKIALDAQEASIKEKFDKLKSIIG